METGRVRRKEVNNKGNGSGEEKKELWKEMKKSIKRLTAVRRDKQ